MPILPPAHPRSPMSALARPTVGPTAGGPGLPVRPAAPPVTAARPPAAARAPGSLPPAHPGSSMGQNYTIKNNSYNKGAYTALTQLKLASTPVRRSPRGGGLPYALALPGAIFGAHRSHEKKNPVIPGAMHGAFGSSVGGVGLGVLGSVAGMHIGSAYHKLTYKGPTGMKRLKALVNAVERGGHLGAAFGIGAGAIGGYELAMRRYEHKVKKLEEHVLKKHNVHK